MEPFKWTVANRLHMCVCVCANVIKWVTHYANVLIECVCVRWWEGSLLSLMVHARAHVFHPSKFESHSLLGASFHHVSSGPWNVRSGIIGRSLGLTSVRNWWLYEYIWKVNPNECETYSPNPLRPIKLIRSNEGASVQGASVRQFECVCLGRLDDITRPSELFRVSTKCGVYSQTIVYSVFASMWCVYICRIGDDHFDAINSTFISVLLLTQNDCVLFNRWCAGWPTTQNPVCLHMAIALIHKYTDIPTAVYLNEHLYNK